MSFREALEKVQAECILISKREDIFSFLQTLGGTVCPSDEANSFLPGLSDVVDVTDDPASADTGISMAIMGVETTGTILLNGEDTCSLLPETSVCILMEKDLAHDLDDLVDRVAGQPEKHLVAVTGPSRTADIEKILVLGAHGPGRLIVLLVQEPQSSPAAKEGVHS